MPQEVIPFELTVRHFFISLFAFLVVVRLLFFVFGGRLLKSRLWQSIAKKIKVAGLDQSIMPTLHSMVESLGQFLLSWTRGRHHIPMPSSDDIEMESVDRSSA